MKQPEDLARVTANISVLYELSLAIGQSLDLEANCDLFLSRLMARKNLTFAAVWLRGPDRGVVPASDEPLELIYANPRFLVRESVLAADDPIAQRTAEERVVSVTKEGPGGTAQRPGKRKASAAGLYLALGDRGILELASSTRRGGFTAEETSQLEGLASKFSDSIQACIEHSALLLEVDKRRQMEGQLHSETERAQVTLAAIGDGVIRTDARGRVDFLNAVAEELTGWDLARAAGRQLSEVFRAADGAGLEACKSLERSLDGAERLNKLSSSLRRESDGRSFEIQYSIAPLRGHDERITGWVLAFTDVTGLRAMERTIQHQATHDPLTGLINRRALEHRLGAAITGARNDGQHHAFAYLDLDDFKVVNDTCGHIAGDQLLRDLAGMLQGRIRKSDMLARLGGDEFGILLFDCPFDQAQRLADKVMAAAKGFKFSWDDKVFAVSMSVGLIPIDASTTGLEDVLSDADAACYVAKDLGGSRVHCSRPDDSVLAERQGEMQWIYRLQKAVDEDRFCLFRQQIHPLSAAAGPPLYEVLVRLIDDDGGIVEPGSFIPAAERFRFMSTLDRWVVRSAFQAIAADSEEGDPASFALNISGQSLSEPEFLEEVEAGLNDSAIEPARILFEVTETAAIVNLGNARDQLGRLRDLGCRIVLDDFGSGVSSFGYLRELPIDILKIDGIFVRSIAEDPIQRVLVESINRIGHAMGKPTMAEWVEDAAVLSILEEIGVDYAQGYFLGRPEPFGDD